MKPAPFSYHDPASIADVVGLLSSEPNCKLLAGGQSLMPMLNLRFLQPDAVIDLNRVAGLSELHAEAGHVRIGAMVRQRSLQFDAGLRAQAPVFAHALEQVGHYQTRARGTIGGSLCHLDPAAELPAVVLLHDAVIHVAGPDGGRDVPVQEWPVGYMAPALAPEELMVGLSFRSWSRGHGWGFHEFARRRGDFALAAAGCLLELDGAGCVSRAALVVSGVSYVPLRLEGAERMMAGRAIDAELVKAIEDEARQSVEMDDVHVPLSYRQQLIAVLMRRAITDAMTRAGEFQRARQA
jgi:carbon-monoxide dehydrogenase medium subunit